MLAMKTKFALFLIAILYSLQGFSQTYIKDVTIIDVNNNKK